MIEQSFGFDGLTSAQVEQSHARFGLNKIDVPKQRALWNALLKALKEPMLLILFAVVVVYFVTGAWAEGIFMVFAIFVVSFISMYQESRTKNALEALKHYTAPKAKVIRNGSVGLINTEEIAVGDYLVIEEGALVPADGVIIQSRDFSVNESLLTGESLAVEKNRSTADNAVYQGTQVVTGQAICIVNHIGPDTKMGKIGLTIQQLKEQPSPLEIQIHHFVARMASIGGIVFVIIWGINLYKSHNILDSLLKALTLAMSIVPEEIPVAFTTFMALGAWRLMRLGILVKNTKTVETLGSANVICVDKTGTITKNAMTLVSVYDLSTDKILGPELFNEGKEVITLAMWASEPVPFDPMEKALHDAYSTLTALDLRPSYSMVHEYPLSGTPPMMTHIFQNPAGEKIIAVKGAPEAVIKASDLSPDKKQSVLNALEMLTGKGYRVLGVGESKFSGEVYPQTQHDLKMSFKGFVAFYDPPKENISSVLKSFYNAGIEVKIITGDNLITTRTVAQQIEFAGAEKIINGDQIIAEDESSLENTVDDTAIYTRMFPEAKLKVVQALKKKNKIVAMVGDGVNDAPALKAANIGIAMGKKGSEVAKEASALILASDDLGGMIDAIAMGRRIYSNLKKAIRYIISIHIPIILIVFIPVVFAWPFPAVFTPVHLIFLELVMGPTCSIIYENEPMEENIMHEPPRRFTTTFFRFHELVISFVQGIIITAGLIAIYFISLAHDPFLAKTTSMIFVTLITSNILLTLVNRSFSYSIIKTSQYKNYLMPRILSATLAAAMAIFFIAPVRDFFHLTMLSTVDVAWCISIGSASVLWFEIYKLVIQKRKSQRTKIFGRHDKHH